MAKKHKPYKERLHKYETRDLVQIKSTKASFYVEKESLVGCIGMIVAVECESDNTRHNVYRVQLSKRKDFWIPSSVYFWFDPKDIKLLI